MRFLHCSDVHITQDYSAAPFFTLGWRRWLGLLELTIGGRATAYRDAKQTLREIVNVVERGEADHLLLSGDLTGYGAENEFRFAREALGAIADTRARFSVIPGNHDCFTPERGEDQEVRAVFRASHRERPARIPARPRLSIRAS